MTALAVEWKLGSGQLRGLPHDQRSWTLSSSPVAGSDRPGDAAQHNHLPLPRWRQTVPLEGRSHSFPEIACHLLQKNTGLEGITLQSLPEYSQYYLWYESASAQMQADVTSSLMQRSSKAEGGYHHLHIHIRV